MFIPTSLYLSANRVLFYEGAQEVPLADEPNCVLNYDGVILTVTPHFTPGCKIEDVTRIAILVHDLLRNLAVKTGKNYNSRSPELLQNQIEYPFYDEDRQLFLSGLNDFVVSVYNVFNHNNRADSTIVSENIRKTEPEWSILDAREADRFVAALSARTDPLA